MAGFLATLGIIYCLTIRFRGAPRPCITGRGRIVAVRGSLDGRRAGRVGRRLAHLSPVVAVVGGAYTKLDLQTA
jgi:hypothetical protein